MLDGVNSHPVLLQQLTWWTSSTPLNCICFFLKDTLINRRCFSVCGESGNCSHFSILLTSILASVRYIGRDYLRLKAITSGLLNKDRLNGFLLTVTTNPCEFLKWTNIFSTSYAEKRRLVLSNNCTAVLVYISRCHFYIQYFNRIFFPE